MEISVGDGAGLAVAARRRSFPATAWATVTMHVAVVSWLTAAVVHLSCGGDHRKIITYNDSYLDHSDGSIVVINKPNTVVVVNAEIAEPPYVFM